MGYRQINTILIANRGEIASRIINTCRKMGITSIAVFSDADRDAPYVKEADKAAHIGESNPSESYLNQKKIIQTALALCADAIHPGYGFLSENADFAKRCVAAGIIFIGPHPTAIELMGSKSMAKSIMVENNVPVIKGYQEKDQSIDKFTNAAREIGFPVLLKAAAGGGGKGMRIVQKESELKVGLAAAKREAMAAFGNDELIMEKYIAKGRHIEFQIFGDQYGNVIHLFERECSIQRRYQKVLEESPSPGLDEKMREKVGAAAIKAAKALNYDNAGTVEFIFDEDAKSFFFLEVNTRLQVEHPVTEEITGLDLVKIQIEVAEGKPLPFKQSEIQSNGYAVETRLYAEDPSNDFSPVTGKVEYWKIPKVDGLRIESAVQTGSEVSIYYDPMIAKIIVWDETRSSAHRKMAYTLRHLNCLGLKTNQDFLLHLFEKPAINKGDYDTNFIQNEINLEDFDKKSLMQQQIALVGITLFSWRQREHSRRLLKAMPSGWRNNPYSFQQSTYLIGKAVMIVKYAFLNNNCFDFEINGKSLNVSLLEVTDGNVYFRIKGIQYKMTLAKRDKHYFIHSPDTGNMHVVEKDRFPKKEVEKPKGGYEAPMPSQVVKILVEEGQDVQAGEALMILSSMKMENSISANESGTVEAVYVKEEQNVEAGFLLLKIRGLEINKLP